jgi:hypothetical protein
VLYCIWNIRIAQKVFGPLWGAKKYSHFIGLSQSLVAVLKTVPLFEQICKLNGKKFNLEDKDYSNSEHKIFATVATSVW